ncbi:MAG TPA: ABC transporter substrate-binding protein, partial [Aggregatilineales bacterium]|nr:ABC transporter substrate-binding protein [Aggregatilineales bacterium]
MSKKHLLIILFSLVILLGTGSVSSQGGSQLPVDVPRESVFVVDQILRYPAPLNFNLWVPGQHPANHHALMYETLWYIDTETGERINALASEQPIYNDDFTEMTVNLREGIYWSDGVEFTAADFVYTIETIMATDGMNWNPVLNQWVESVEQMGDNTVVFHLSASNNRFHYNFEPGWNGVYMMPKHVFENVDDLLTYDNNPPLSLSAYEFVEGDAQGFWELYQRRDDWEQTFVGMQTGKPGPEYILTIFYGGSERKAIAMARHELDIFFDLDKEAFGAVLDSTPSARPWYENFPWAYPNELDARYLGFNQQGNVHLQNRDVRWALTLALNIVEMETQYLGGVERITAIPQPATSALMELYHNPMEEWLTNLQIDLGDGEMYNPYDSTVPDQVAAWAAEQGYEVGDDARALFGTGWWKHDPETAARLMEKAGFTRNDD